MLPLACVWQVTTAIRGLANKEVLQGQQEVKKAVLSALEQAEQRLAEQAGRRRSYACVYAPWLRTACRSYVPPICALAANCICRVHTGRSIV